ncbi:hypothetical protein [Actinobacillus equuli]|uniref:hypothetical protein n=1 Tax=Actinobacillus equuli TaxID=718 RepID=UPI002442B09E|nr:hypothetical protein [Actinobacillus equuli]WGE75161.1 hypothetical protein NYR81_09520 [Actinobacillus equuli subsp. haemolyticus]WGE77075.1 hypothetical protein NYR82_09515 [Actinobacillus equuli subsp. haemolyticus]
MVSQERGIANYIENSQYLGYKEELSEALESFLPIDSVNDFKDVFKFENNLSLIDEINEELESYVYSLDLIPEATSSYIFDISDISIYTLVPLIIRDSEGFIDFDVLEVDDKSATIKIVIVCDISVDVELDFFIKDSVDKEYICIGRDGTNIERRIDVEAIISLSLKREVYFNIIDNVNIDSIEFNSEPIYLYLGEVEPYYQPD